MTYTYDEVGNRLTKVDSGAAAIYRYHAADQWREKLSRPLPIGRPKKVVGEEENR